MTTSEIRREDRILFYLGGAQMADIKGSDLRSPLGVVKVVKRGLPYASAAHARAHLGLQRKIFDSVIPRQTLSSTQKSPNNRLTTAQSEKLIRIARTYAMAEEAFGDRERGEHWMGAQNPALDDARPVELLDTAPGGELIEQMLGRMMYGVDA